jgi:hypothetical protein
LGSAIALDAISVNEEQEQTSAVLLLDDCECAVGLDRVPPGTSLSSNAGTSASRGLAAASASMR